MAGRSCGFPLKIELCCSRGCASLKVLCGAAVLVHLSLQGSAPSWVQLRDAVAHLPLTAHLVPVQGLCLPQWQGAFCASLYSFLGCWEGLCRGCYLLYCGIASGCLEMASSPSGHVLPRCSGLGWCPSRPYKGCRTPGIAMGIWRELCAVVSNFRSLRGS